MACYRIFRNLRAVKKHHSHELLKVRVGPWLHTACCSNLLRLLGFYSVRIVATLIQWNSFSDLCSPISRVQSVPAETTVWCWRRSLARRKRKSWSLLPRIIVSNELCFLKFSASKSDCTCSVLLSSYSTCVPGAYSLNYQKFHGYILVYSAVRSASLSTLR
jgi:hypothetical protein